MSEEKSQNKIKRIYRTVRPLLFGCVTGIITGVVLSLFLICSRIIISFAFGMYRAADTPLAVVCVIALALLCCLLSAIIQDLVPHSKGSGIPLAEGCARGMLRTSWLKSTAALIIGSFLSFASGLPVGSEGPSICTGGLIGDGLGKAAKSDELRRYLITGGASAGLAVAFNAPLTGVAFALEETHRRFSPGILVAAFSTVIPAVAISRLLFWAFGHSAYLSSLGIDAGTTILPYLAQASYSGVADFFSVCGIALICGIACAGLATLFNYVVFALGGIFGKIKNSALRLLPVFALTVICGFSFSVAIGSGEATLETLFEDTSPTLWIIFAALAVRFVLTALAGGSGASGGLFLPMIAISGLFGTIAARLCVMCGLPNEYIPNIVILCIASFFAASVRAPISAVAMAIELTASFANLLPVTVAVGIATAAAGIMRSAPLYERLMENIQASEFVAATAKDMTAECTVKEDSPVCGKRIRDVLWIYNSLVTSLDRQGTYIVPDGETTLTAGDKLVIRAERVSPDEFISVLSEYVTVENYYETK